VSTWGEVFGATELGGAALSAIALVVAGFLIGAAAAVLAVRAINNC